MTKKQDSTEVFLIKKAYDLMGDRLTWDSDKVHHLMDTCNLSYGVMAAYLRATPNQFEGWMKKNYFSKQVGLLLHQLAVQRGFYTAWPQGPSEGGNNG